MRNEIIPKNNAAELRPQVEVEKHRAEKEIEGGMILAKRFPRDMVASEQRILESCRRVSLAESAFFRYPRGGQTLEGPTIRLAEVLANSWGNIQYGFKILERGDDESTVDSFCWDLETNVRVSRTFVVSHQIQLKNGNVKILKDPRDIYEIEANYAQRRVRACILEVIPHDICQSAIRECKKTLEIGQKNEPIIDRVRKMVGKFKDLGVSQTMIEKRVGHNVDLITNEEIVELISIYNAINDGNADRDQFFEMDRPQIFSDELGEVGDFAVKFGKFKGKMIKEIPIDDLVPFYEEMKTIYGKSDQNNFSKDKIDFLKNAEEWIKKTGELK